MKLQELCGWQLSTETREPLGNDPFGPPFS